jgi:hypothetical protein
MVSIGATMVSIGATMVSIGATMARTKQLIAVRHTKGRLFQSQSPRPAPSFATSGVESRPAIRRMSNPVERLSKYKTGRLNRTVVRQFRIVLLSGIARFS